MKINLPKVKTGAEQPTPKVVLSHIAGQVVDWMDEQCPHRNDGRCRIGCPDCMRELVTAFEQAR